MYPALENTQHTGTQAERLMAVIDGRQIETVFQPIVSLRDGSVYGYEALSRGPQDSDMHYPAVLFDCAEKSGKTWELEQLCRMKAIETAGKQLPQFKLFLNVNPKIIHDEKFKQGFTKEYLTRHGLDPENVIFEITEKSFVSDAEAFIETINNYKGQNYRIAVDDAGAGYSGLNLITDIHPHFIKLDMNLVRGIDSDQTKQSLIKCLTEFASLTKTLLIAEGIETKAELLKLIELGVNYGQGFFIQTPEIKITPLKETVRAVICDANKQKNRLTDRLSSDIYICNIATPQRCVHPKMLVSSVRDIMDADQGVTGLCVTEDEAVVGIITRSELYRRLSFQYGYSLYSNKAVETIMSQDFLCVDHHDSIEAVAKSAMGRSYDKLYDLVTVVKNGRYCGIVTVKDLLEKALQIGVNNARHLNPLSGLPGNVAIERELERSISLGDELMILYLDLDNFKAYNDVYGFENGDRIIKCVTGILKNNIRSFIGHIGGDDFVAIVPADESACLCGKIIQEFDTAVKSYYNKSDLDKGYITSRNRHGIEEAFPILSLSITAVPNKGYHTVFSLSEDMARLKKACKQLPGSNFLVK